MSSKKIVLFALSILLFALNTANGQVTQSITATPTTVSVGHFYEVELALQNGVEVSRDISYQLTLPPGHQAYLLPDLSTVSCSATELNGRDMEWDIVGGLNHQTVGVNLSFMQVDSSCSLHFWVQASEIGSATLSPSLTVLGEAQGSSSVNITTNDLGVTATFRPLAELVSGDTATLVMDIEMDASLFIAPFNVRLPDQLKFLDTTPRVQCDVMALHHSLNTTQSVLSFTHASLSTNDAGATCSVEMDVRATSPGMGLIKSSAVNKGTAFIFGSTFLFQLQPVDLGTAMGFSTVANTDLIFLLNATPNTVEPGNTIDLTYSIFGTERGAEYNNGTLTHDLSTQLPGASFGEIKNVSGCISVGNAVINEAALSLTNLAAEAGTSCEVTVIINVPASLDAGSNSLSASLSVDSGGELISKTATLPLSVARSLVGNIESTDTLMLPSSAFRFSVSLTHPTGLDNGLFLVQKLLELSSFQDISIENAQNCTPSLGLSNYLNNPELSLNSVTLAAETPCTFDIVGTWNNSISTGNHDIVLGRLEGNVLTPLSTATVVSPKKPIFTARVARSEVPNQVSVIYDFDTSLNGGDVPGPQTANIEFSHDLSGLIPGVIAPVTLQTDFCGPGSSASINSGILTVLIPLLDENSTCSLNVALNLPAAMAPRTYTNSTSTISYDVFGQTYTHDPLVVSYAHAGVIASVSANRAQLSAGDSIEYTVTLKNDSSTSAITNLNLIGRANGDLSFVEISPALWCGASSATNVSPTIATLSNGDLAPGQSCDFTLTYVVNPEASVGSVRPGDFTLTAQSEGINFSQSIALSPFDIVDTLFVHQHFTKSSIGLNDETTLITVLTNQSNQALQDVSTTIPIDGFLPSLQVLPHNAQNCGGEASLTLTQDNEVKLENAEIAADSECTITIPLASGPEIPVLTEGTVVTSVDYTKGERPFTTASEPLTLRFQELELSLTWSEVAPGETGSLTTTFARRGTGLEGKEIDFFLDTTQAISGIDLLLSETTNCDGADIDVSEGIIRIRRLSLAQDIPCVLTIQTTIATTVIAGTYEMRSEPVLSDQETVLDGQETSLTVVYRPLTAAMSALPLNFPEQTETRLTIDIDNSASAIDANGTIVALNLPAGLNLVPDSAETDCGNSVTTTQATSQAAQFELGSVSAGAMCALNITLEATVPGEFLVNGVNITAHTGTALSNSVTLDASIVPAMLSLSLEPNVLFVGQRASVTVKVDNQGSGADVTATEVALAYPEALRLANGTDVQSNCAELTSVIANGSLELLTMGTPAFEQCLSSFELEATAPVEATITGAGSATPHGPFDPLSETVIFEPAPTYTLSTDVATSIQEGETFTVSVAVSNTSTRLAAQAVNLVTSWNENVTPIPSQPPRSNCTYETGELSLETRRATLIFDEVEAEQTCTLDIDMIAQKPFSGRLSVLSVAVPSGFLEPSQINVEISKKPMNFGLTAGPEVAFIGTGAYATLTFDNSASATQAENIVGQIDVANALFELPLNYTTSCANLNLIPDTDSRATVLVSQLGAGQACSLEVALTGDYTGLAAPTFVLSAEHTAPVELSTQFRRELGPASQITLNPSMPIPEGEAVSATITIRNRAVELPVNEVFVAFEWDSLIAPIEQEPLSSSCEMTEMALDLENGTGTVTINQIAANSECSITLSTLSSLPGNGSVAITEVSSSAGLPIEVSASDFTVVQAPLGYEMTATPNLDFEGRLATVALRIDNRNSAARAERFGGTMEIVNGTFTAPLSWESTCPEILLLEGPDEHTLRIQASSLPAGFACDVNIEARAELLGTTRITGTFESATSPSAQIEASFVREPLPRLVARLNDTEVEMGQSTTLRVEVSNLSSSLALENVGYQISQQGASSAIEALSLNCAGRQGSSEPLETTINEIAAGERCTAEWTITPTEVGSIDITIDSAQSNAGTFPDQRLVLEVRPAVMTETDVGATEADAGVADGGVDDTDAMRTPVMVDANSGCDCSQSNESPLSETIWAFIALAGLLRIRRRPSRRRAR